MTALPTCKNCVREKQPCERRDGVRQALKGLGITTARFACKERVSVYAPGQRVTVTWPVQDPDGYDMPTLESWPATVVKEIGPTFLIRVDDALSDHETLASEFLTNPSRYAKVRVTKLKPLDEPPVQVCAHCGRTGEGGLGVDGCWGTPTPYRPRPRGCTAKTEEAPR